MALVMLVLLASGSSAVVVVQQMRGLRASFDLLTGVYVPFQDRLSEAHVQAAKISALVSEWSLGEYSPRPGDLLNFQEAVQERLRLVRRARQPLEEGLEHRERIGGEDQLTELRALVGLMDDLEAVVAIDEELTAQEVLADVDRQVEINRLFRELELAASEVVSDQRDLVRANAQRSEQFTMLVTIAAGVLTLLATFAVIVTLRPLRRLTGGVQELGRGNWGQRIEVGHRPERDDEVARLAREFNLMGDALQERERRLLVGERLATIGQFASQITHEIRNPLSSVALNAELLEDEIEDASPEAKQLFSRISGEIDRLTHITEAYLSFARRPEPIVAPLDLAAEVGDLLDFLEHEHAQAGIEVVRDLAPAWVQGDGNQLRQAFLNLLRNAAEAVLEPREGGERAEVARPRIEVHVHCKDDLVIAVVRDNGPGISGSADEMERIFEAFFTKKAQGTGLGLPMVQQIVNDHAGTIAVSDTGPSGTGFEVRLPACDPRAPSVSSETLN